MPDNRAKMELIWTGEGLPEVKFFGDIRPNDIRYAKLAIQRRYGLFILELNNKSRAKREALELQKKEDEAKLATEAKKVKAEGLRKEAHELEKQANKEGERHESGTNRPVKEGSRSTETSSKGSGTTGGQGSRETVRTVKDR